MLLSAPGRAASEKPAQPDGLGHRASRVGVLPGLGTKLSLPDQHLAQIRAWSRYLVECPMEGLPQAWDACGSTALAACLYQLPNCGPYLAARALGWLCVAGLVTDTGGCLGPGAVASLHHLLAGDRGDQQGKSSHGEWPWTAPQLHQLTRQLAAAAGVNYWDTQGALCLWMQLGFGTKPPACQTKPGSASSAVVALLTPPPLTPALVPSSPPPRIKADSCDLPPPPGPLRRQQQLERRQQHQEDEEQQQEQHRQQHLQQIATSNPAAATLPEETGRDPAPCEAASCSTRPGEPDAAPVTGSFQDNAKDHDRCSSERALVAEPALTKVMHQELESWMARIRQGLVPVANLMTRALGFQHAAAFRAVVGLYGPRFLLASADRLPGPARRPQLTAAAGAEGCWAGVSASPRPLVWASSGIPASARAAAELEVLRALDFAGPRLLLPSL